MCGILLVAYFPYALLVAFLLGGGIFAVRHHRESRALESRAGSLKRSVESPDASAASPASTPAAVLDRHSILRAPRGIRHQSESDQPKMEAVMKSLTFLPAAELEQLLKEAAAPQPAPKDFLELVAEVTGSVLAEKDASAAVGILSGLPPGGRMRDRIFTKTLAGWTRGDPGAAAAWIRKALADGKLNLFKIATRGNVDKPCLSAV
ncbi:MAG: hypothetical protein EOP86_00860 [Verrucomicrobiaceae bacterium]|nr:MAG: hypothetical protein EOP86_00860 [Verrucomicrobiaceae bacterium]